MREPLKESLLALGIPPGIERPGPRLLTSYVRRYRVKAISATNATPKNNTTSHLGVSIIASPPSPSTPRRRGGAGLRAALLPVAATIASPSCVPGASGHFSSTDVACDPTRLQGRAEGRVVPFGLVGVALREVGDHRLEPLALTEVSCDLHAVSGAGMRAGKHPAA